MREFIVLDSETDPFRHGRIPAPFVWGMYDGATFRHYHQSKLDELIEYISARKVIVYAHNGGKFDWHFITRYMQVYDDILVINGRIAQFRIGEAEFRDSYNILPVPLKAYDKEEIDYSLFEEDERYKNENWDKIIAYLKSDCVNLYRMINEFQESYGRNLTQAGTAMRQWKKRSKQKLPESNRYYFSLFKPYYYGGRVECFRKGIIEENFSVYDINSAYPYAMLKHHPYGTEYTEYSEEQPDLDIGPAFFRVRCISKGAFPYREKNKLTFPNDDIVREYRVTGWELQAARDTGTIEGEEIISVIYFTEQQSFSEYINHFYEKRKRFKELKDHSGQLFAKLLMNSLYGKFGANCENYSKHVLLPKSELPHIKDTEWHFVGELGDNILVARDLEEHEERYYNVATAASITGFVRAYLWRAINSVGIENMLYCDTDSIACAGDSNSLSLGDALGDWKHEGDFDKAGIGGKKLYIFRPASSKWDYKMASKGAILTKAQLWKVAEGETVIYKPDAPTFSISNIMGESPEKRKSKMFLARRISITT